MSPENLDRVFTELSHTLTRVGEDEALLFLSRFALLASIELDDPELCLALIRSAEISDQPNLSDS
jgi:hypothetical protein